VNDLFLFSKKTVTLAGSPVQIWRTVEPAQTAWPEVSLAVTAARRDGRGAEVGQTNLEREKEGRRGVRKNVDQRKGNTLTH